MATHDEKGRLAEQLKDEFIALVSDDLLTPITAIKASAELIQTFADLGPQAKLARLSLSNILASTGRLTAMVNDLLDISRLDTNSFQVAVRPISLRDFLPAVVSRLEIPPGHQHVDLTLRDGLPLAWADPALLERIVKNLLANAVKHSPPGAAISLQASAESEKISISVIDHGTGIAAQDLPHVFERLCRTPAGGLGLCLYITRRSVEALNGHIRVTSKLGAGSTFTFSLPCVAAGHLSDR